MFENKENLILKTFPGISYYQEFDTRIGMKKIAIGKSSTYVNLSIDTPMQEPRPVVTEKHDIEHRSISIRTAVFGCFGSSRFPGKDQEPRFSKQIVFH